MSVRRPIFTFYLLTANKNIFWQVLYGERLRGGGGRERETSVSNPSVSKGQFTSGSRTVSAVFTGSCCTRVNCYRDLDGWFFSWLCQPCHLLWDFVIRLSYCLWSVVTPCLAGAVGRGEVLGHALCAGRAK